MTHAHLHPRTVGVALVGSVRTIMAVPTLAVLLVPKPTPKSALDSVSSNGSFCVSRARIVVSLANLARTVPRDLLVVLLLQLVVLPYEGRQI